MKDPATSQDKISKQRAEYEERMLFKSFMPDKIKWQDDLIPHGDPLFYVCVNHMIRYTKQLMWQCIHQYSSFYMLHNVMDYLIEIEDYETCASLQKYIDLVNKLGIDKKSI